MKWVGNVLACTDGTLMSAFRDRLELRGPGWEPRRGTRARRAGVDCRSVPCPSLRFARKLAAVVGRIAEGGEIPLPGIRRSDLPLP